jgi:hypothetical protein
VIRGDYPAIYENYCLTFSSLLHIQIDLLQLFTKEPWFSDNYFALLSKGRSSSIKTPISTLSAIMKGVQTNTSNHMHNNAAVNRSHLDRHKSSKNHLYQPTANLHISSQRSGRCPSSASSK